MKTDQSVQEWIIAQYKGDSLEESLKNALSARCLYDWTYDELLAVFKAGTSF